MPEWLVDFLGGPTYMIAKAIWEGTFLLLNNLMGATPMEFSSSAWNLVEGTLFPWAQGIGIVLLNTFVLIGFVRDNTNLKENFTLEMFLMAAFRLLCANGIIVGGLQLVKTFFIMAAELTGEIYRDTTPSLALEDFDGGSFFFFTVFGVIYVLVALACSFIILLSVYGRYLKLYVMTISLPIAISTLAGGKGIAQTGFAYIKAFFATTFEIVVIGLFLSVAARMMSSIDFGKMEGLIATVDGFHLVLQSMMTMIILAAAVKGAEAFMRRFFGL